jgi:hypothetical protein
MLDFSKLLSTLSEEVKRKPHQKPIGMPLPSEQAIEEVAQGVQSATQPAEQAIATREGIADEPANADNITTTVPNMGMEVQRRPTIPLPTQDESTVDWSQVSPQVDRNRKPSLQEDIATGEQKLRSAVNAPIQPQSWWKDFGAKLIQGADAFFNGNRAPIVGWGRLKHDYAVQQAQGKLNPLLAMQKQENEQLKAAQDQAMGQLEYRLKVNKGLQDAFNNDPDVLIIKQSNRVTPEQAQRLNAKYGASYSPAYWGKYITEERGGKQYIRPEDRPNYVENTSVPVDLPKTTVSVPLSGGGQGYITSADAVKNDSNERVAGITANRQIAIADANNEIEVNKTNAKAINDHHQATTEFLLKRQAALTALGKDVPKNVQMYSSQLAKDEAEYDKANNSGDVDAAVTAYQKYMKTLDSLNKAMETAAKNDIDMKNAIDAIPMPQKPVLVKHTKINMGGNSNTPRTTSVAEATQYFSTVKGLKGAELQTAIANARKKGLIK